MKDEFRMTPVDVRNQEFGRTAFGYERAVVDDFRDRVATELERLLKERQSLEERVAGLREQLKVFREREKALNDALVAAQQARADTERLARQEAQLIVREARLEGERLLAEAGLPAPGSWWRTTRRSGARWPTTGCSSAGSGCRVS